jgi:hypothetical protein
MLIDQIDSRSSFRVMERFVAQLDDAPADHLERALRGRKPFSAFKDALFEYPALQTAWFAFEQAAHLVHADAWCKEDAIKVEWT